MPNDRTPESAHWEAIDPIRVEATVGANACQTDKPGARTDRPLRGEATTS